MGLYLMGRGDIRPRQTRKSRRFFHTIWMDGALIKLLQFSLISRQGFEKSMKDFVIQACRSTPFVSSGIDLVKGVCSLEKRRNYFFAKIKGGYIIPPPIK